MTKEYFYWVDDEAAASLDAVCDTLMKPVFCESARFARLER